MRARPGKTSRPGSPRGPGWSCRSSWLHFTGCPAKAPSANAAWEGSPHPMKAEILYPGAFAMAKLMLATGEEAKAESGAMVSMSATIDVESKLEGGMFSALKRKLLTGEKFFFQT